METKTLALADFKADLTGDGPGTLEGYGSTFGNLDSYGDTIAPGAYRDTIPDFLHRGFLADEHDWARRVGTIAAAHEDDAGLRIVAEFHSDTRSQDMRRQVQERLERGKFVGLSIGYEAQDFEYRQAQAGETVPYGDKVRVLKRIKLFEVSVVSVPADDYAAVTAAKTAALHAFLADLKVGRRLSAATRTELQAALDAITRLLADDAALVEPDKAAPVHMARERWEVNRRLARIRRELGGVA